MANCNKDCTICSQSNLDCNGQFVEWVKKPQKNIFIQTFKPYFDVTMAKVVNSKREIKEYCKQNDFVYAGDKELTQQCEQNKRDNAIKQDRAFVDNLARELERVI